MKFASVADMKNRLSYFLGEAHKTHEAIMITNHGKPYAILQPLTDADLEKLEWKRMAEESLQRAWEGESDELYDYL